jgi:lipopolysaccharide export system protein LptA
MKRSDAARYARWSALLALGLAGVTGIIYTQRLWVAHLERQNAPAPLPQTEEKRLTTLNIKKVEGTHTIFSVEAGKSTDLRGQDISLLEDVRILVNGKSGDRHDLIHTQSCRYSKTDGGIQCEGNVQFDLQSAEDAARVEKNPGAKPNIIHIDTTAVTFERSTGRAQTVQPVRFTFTNGRGDGIGAVYQSEEGQLHLIRDVHIHVLPAAPRSGKKPSGAIAQVDIQGTGMELDKINHSMVLAGPASAMSTTQQLTGGEFRMMLDAEFHAQELIALPGALQQRPQVVQHGPKGDSKLLGNKLTAELSPRGWATRIVMDGKVEGSSPSGNLRAESAEMEMWPQVNQARLLTLRGNVHADTRDAKTGQGRTLTTNALQLSFAGGKAGEANRVEHAETLERGTLEWLDAALVRSKISADKLAMEFAERGKPQLLNATGKVETQREAPGKSVQTASSATGVAQMSAGGDWSQIMLRGNVRMQDADRNAEAQQAVFNHASQTTVLTGQAMVRDASSETHAPKFTFQQATGDLEAEGPVRSTDFSHGASGLQMSPAPANVTAEHLRANSKTGRALYTGHARLWQGPSVLEADSIELLRETRVLNAAGNVRGVFPQAPQPGTSASAAPVWHVVSALLTYWDKEDRAHLEKNVFVQSADQKMRSPQLELYFTRSGSDKAGSGGTSQVSRAVGTGGVAVEQGNRRGTAERGVYTAADQKFVLSGGTPTLFDPAEGTTIGRELTFNSADDTIIVDSGNGLRTMTRHRVQ